MTITKSVKTWSKVLSGIAKKCRRKDVAAGGIRGKGKCSIINNSTFISQTSVPTGRGKNKMKTSTFRFLPFFTSFLLPDRYFRSFLSPNMSINVIHVRLKCRSKFLLLKNYWIFGRIFFADLVSFFTFKVCSFRSHFSPKTQHVSGHNYFFPVRVSGFLRKMYCI